MSSQEVVTSARHPDRVLIAAQALADARRSGMLLDPFTPPIGPGSIDDALAIQTASAESPVRGWKCALPVDDRLIVAPLRAAAFVEAPGPVAIATPKLRYEPELAFVLAHDLPGEGGVCDRATALRAIGSARLALELVHGRFRDPDAAPFLDMLADDLFNEAVILGPKIALDAIDAIDTITIEDGEGVRALPAQHAAGDPLAPLVWLAGHLAAGGSRLRAGTIVITGSFTPVQTVTRSGAIDVGFGALGEIAARFEFRGGTP